MGIESYINASISKSSKCGSSPSRMADNFIKSCLFSFAKGAPEVGDDWATMALFQALRYAPYSQSEIRDTLWQGIVNRASCQEWWNTPNAHWLGRCFGQEWVALNKEAAQRMVESGKLPIPYFTKGSDGLFHADPDNGREVWLVVENAMGNGLKMIRAPNPSQYAPVFYG